MTTVSASGSSAERYEDLVDEAIAFSRQEHQFFLDVKYDLMARLLTERYGSLTDLAVLDLGCGIGTSHSSAMSSAGALYGTDVDIDCLHYANKRFPDVPHTAFDGLRLPFRSESLDVAFATCVLHHVRPTDLRPLLAEVHRVLRPGGTIVVAEHNPLNPLTRLTVMRCQFDVDVHLLTARRSRRLLQTMGFAPIGTHFTLMFPWRPSAFRAIERSFRRLPLGAQYLFLAAKPSAETAPDSDTRH